MIQRYDRVYNYVMVHMNRNNISEIFVRVNVNNFGRAMAYLAIVYLMNESEEVMREAVHLVIAPLRNIDFQHLELKRGFFTN